MSYEFRSDVDPLRIEDDGETVFRGYQEDTREGEVLVGYWHADTGLESFYTTLQDTAEVTDETVVGGVYTAEAADGPRDFGTRAPDGAAPRRVADLDADPAFPDHCGYLEVMPETGPVALAAWEDESTPDRPDRTEITMWFREMDADTVADRYAQTGGATGPGFHTALEDLITAAQD